MKSNMKQAVSNSTDELYRDALNNIRQGEINKAKALAKRMLKLNSKHADANYLLGIIATQKEKPALACKHFELAIKADDQQPMYFYNLGVVLGLLSRLDKAQVVYEKAVKLKPDLAEAHNNLGILFHTTGSLDKALSAYNRVIQLQPNNAGAYCNRANALKDLGELEDAIKDYQHAIEIQPDKDEYHYNLGVLFESMGRFFDALNAYEQATKNNPLFAEAHCNHGVVLVNLGRPKEAENSYRHALEIKPDYLKAHSNLLFSLNYRTDLSQNDIFIAHCEWEKKHARVKPLSISRNYRRTNHKLRIGYVSPDFYNHSVAFFFVPLLIAHDRDDFEIYCYSNTASNDEVTESIKSKTDHWRSILEVSDKKAAKMIQQDKIDILVDLTGHTAGNRLPVFTYRPAPIQITWLGYPNTTGLQSIDYRLTDNIADPTGDTDAFYTEKLIRLDPGFLCYQQPDSAPEVSEAPCLNVGYITFGSFNVMAKINSEVISIWSKILCNLPESRLLLKNNGLGDNRNKERILNLFIEHGIDKHRIELYGRLPKQKDHLDLYRKIDISLDTFPYNGTTTSCEALWMGIPVITLRGNQHASRVGASILRQLDYRKWIAATTSSYIEIAVELAGDIQGLSDLRASLRNRMLKSTLLDAKTFATTIENAYRMIWDEHLNQIQ